MSRRLILLGVIVIAAGVAVAATVWPARGARSVIAGVHPTRPAPLLKDRSGIVRVPGMTKWISTRSSVCDYGRGGGTKGVQPRLPKWCYEVKATGSLFQQWTTNRKSPDSSPGASVIVLRLQTHGQAELLLHTPDYVGESNAVERFRTGPPQPAYTPLSGAAINGGIANRFASPPGKGIFRFVWVGGTDVVEVTVFGKRLAAAQKIAQLVRPT